MSDSPPRRPRPNGDSGGDPNFNWRGLVLLSLALLLVTGAFIPNKWIGHSHSIEYPKFLEKLRMKPETLIDRSKPLKIVIRPDSGNEFIEGYFRTESGQSESFQTQVQSKWLEPGALVKELASMEPPIAP